MASGPFLRLLKAWLQLHLACFPTFCSHHARHVLGHPDLQMSTPSCLISIWQLFRSSGSCLNCIMDKTIILHNYEI